MVLFFPCNKRDSVTLWSHSFNFLLLHKFIGIFLLFYGLRQARGGNLPVATGNSTGRSSRYFSLGPAPIGALSKSEGKLETCHGNSYCVLGETSVGLCVLFCQSPYFCFSLSCVSVEVSLSVSLLNSPLYFCVSLEVSLSVSNFKSHLNSPLYFCVSLSVSHLNSPLYLCVSLSVSHLNSPLYLCVSLDFSLVFLCLT